VGCIFGKCVSSRSLSQSMSAARAHSLPVYVDKPLISWVVLFSCVCAAEMAHKTPLFPGDSELQQLLHIFK